MPQMVHQRDTRPSGTSSADPRLRLLRQHEQDMVQDVVPGPRVESGQVTVAVPYRLGDSSPSAPFCVSCLVPAALGGSQHQAKPGQRPGSGPRRPWCCSSPCAGPWGAIPPGPAADPWCYGPGLDPSADPWGTRDPSLIRVSGRGPPDPWRSCPGLGPVRHQTRGGAALGQD